MRLEGTENTTPEIFVLVGSLEVGGTERHLATILPRLVRMGWRASLYSMTGSGPLERDLEAGGVSVLMPPSSKQRGGARWGRLLRQGKLAWHLFSTMRARRPPIAHFFLPGAYLVGAPLALVAGVPVRLMSRRSLSNYQKSRWWIAHAEGLLHPTMTAILGNSRRVVEELAGERGVSRDRLFLIYNGVDVSRFETGLSRASKRAELGLRDGTLVFTIVANLILYKGHDDLIEALGRCRSQLPKDWRLLVVGRDDGIGAALMEKASALAIRDNLSLLGSRGDVPEILMASDIGVLSSHEEGFSNAVLEGMAAGLPMVVTDVGGNSEAVLDGECGIVVPPHDPQRLAEALISLANDAEKRARYGEASRRRIGEHFSIEACAANYDTLYRDLLARRADRS